MAGSRQQEAAQRPTSHASKVSGVIECSLGNLDLSLILLLTTSIILCTKRHHVAADAILQ